MKLRALPHAGTALRRVNRPSRPFVKPESTITGRMFTLFHHPFCREAFLALNPAGETPVLVAEGTAPMPGAGLIAEFLDEIHGAPLGDHRLLPDSPAARVEVRRLTAWFNENGVPATGVEGAAMSRTSIMPAT